jgi:hypothetical protein
MMACVAASSNLTILFPTSSRFWGLTWVAWTFFVGQCTKRWWSRRADFDATLAESWWFARVSTATVGLGDFFLQPEVMFVDDLLTFTLTFLTGFVFLSAFLGKLMDLVGGHFPDHGPKLCKRLDKSNFVFQDDDETTKQKDEKEQRLCNVESLEKLAQDTDEDPSQEPLNVYEEEQLLFLLLRDAKTRRGRLEEASLHGSVLLDLDDETLKNALFCLDRPSLGQVAPSCCQKLRNLSPHAALGLR